MSTIKKRRVIGEQKDEKSLSLWKLPPNCQELVDAIDEATIRRFGDNSGIASIETYTPPDWKSGLPGDILTYICSFLPIDKIFIMAGMCQRFRRILFIEDRRGINWINQLSLLRYHPIPPPYPRSKTEFSEPDHLGKTDLLRWGASTIVSLRKKGASVIGRLPNQDQSQLALAADYEEPFISSQEKEGVKQFIWVVLGSNAHFEPFDVTSDITCELLEVVIRESKLGKNVLKNTDELQFTILTPRLEDVKDWDDAKFKRLKQGIPSRENPKDRSSSVVNPPWITYTPRQEQFIPWPKNTSLSCFAARIGWIVKVAVSSRKYFRNGSNEDFRKTIYSRFNDEKYCKHCYRWMDERETCCKVPSEWKIHLKDLWPICIHCLTHRMPADSILDTRNSVEQKCPKCNVPMAIKRDVIGLDRNRVRKGHYNYFFCAPCCKDGMPVLYFAYVRKIILFKPYVDAWKALAKNDYDNLPPALLKDHVKKVDDWFAKIKEASESILYGVEWLEKAWGWNSPALVSNILSNVTNSVSSEWGLTLTKNNVNYPENDIQEQDDKEKKSNSEEDMIESPLSQKRPTTGLKRPRSGIGPPKTGKRPLMSPVMSHHSPQKKKRNNDEEEEEDDEISSIGNCQNQWDEEGDIPLLPFEYQ